MVNVIGVASQAQNGKDTLADYLATVLNNTEAVALDKLWARRAFATNVKKVFCDAFGVDSAFIEKWKVIDEAPPGFDMPIRKALQFVGDGFRKIKSSIWMDLTFNELVDKIISDVRYINEFVRVKKEGGLNILIGRPDRLNYDPNGSESEIRPYIEWCYKNFPDQRFVDLTKVDFKSFSEDNLPPANMECFDVFMKNNMTVEDFYKLIDESLISFVNDYKFN